MARETDIITSDGLTLYQTIRRASDGQYYNGSTFEAFNAAHWTTYATALSKAVLSSSVSADYSINFPALAAGQYHVEIYSQVGGSPAVSDGPPQWQYIIAWNGTAEVTVNNVNLGQWIGSTPKTLDAGGSIMSNAGTNQVLLTPGTATGQVNLTTGQVTTSNPAIVRNITVAS